MATKMMQATELLPQWFAELPDEWRYLDGDDTLPVQLDEERVSSALRLPFTESDAFWSLP
ncbi:HipA family kinase [Prosthecobacter sp.]|uniref:HipA family kinase n=1 Tax=Prosthecobacter sp. TaxID=1965333 RepID=UPI003904BCD7